MQRNETGKAHETEAQPPTRIHPEDEQNAPAESHQKGGI